MHTSSLRLGTLATDTCVNKLFSKGFFTFNIHVHVLSHHFYSVCTLLKMNFSQRFQPLETEEKEILIRGIQDL